MFYNISYQHVESLSIRIELMSKMSLHYVTLHSNTHYTKYDIQCLIRFSVIPPYSAQH